jgi:hypothetical protein
MSAEFKIEEIKSGYEDGVKKSSCEYLPKLSFSWLIVGARRSGKSNFIRNILIKECYLGKLFEREHIFLFCPTVNLNNDFESLKIPKENTFEGFDKSIIEEILKEQEMLINNYGRKRTPNILLIFDDCAYGNMLQYNSIVNKLAMNGRHYKISFILTTQTLKSVSTKTRRNLDALTFFPNSVIEIDAVAEEYIPKKYRKKMSDKLYDLSKVPYSFFHMNRIGEKRYSFNFTDINEDEMI